MGAYHWATHTNVQKQINNFLSTADPDEHTLVALDFEDTPGNQMTLAQARDFLRRSRDLRAPLRTDAALMHPQA